MANKKYNVPIARKLLLTIEEASAYSGISEERIRMFFDAPNFDFILFCGRKKLIKRAKFEKYLMEFDDGILFLRE